MASHRVTVLFSEEDMLRLRQMAGLVPLGPYIRSILGLGTTSAVAELADARPRRAPKLGVVQGRVAEVSGNHEPERTQPLEGSTPSRAIKTCIHGTAKGWNCWQCGGLAVIP